MQSGKQGTSQENYTHQSGKTQTPVWKTLKPSQTIPNNQSGKDLSRSHEYNEKHGFVKHTMH